MEHTLVRIWQEILGLDERIGIYDDFFDLGGHSLLAIEAAIRISGRFAVRVSVKTVFEAPTVAAMGVVIAHKRRAGTAEEAVPWLPAGADDLMADGGRLP